MSGGRAVIAKYGGMSARDALEASLKSVACVEIGRVRSSTPSTAWSCAGEEVEVSIPDAFAALGTSIKAEAPDVIGGLQTGKSSLQICLLGAGDDDLLHKLRVVGVCRRGWRACL